LKRNFWSARLSHLLAIIGTVLLIAEARAEKEVPPPVDPLTLYGDEIYFDVYRHGNRVGFHRVQLDAGDDGVIVQSTFKLQIDILFFTAYRYHYRSEGLWRDGELVRLDASVDDDGAVSSVEAVRDGERMTIIGADGRFNTKAPLYPTNHWNAAVLRETTVLNTLTGQVNEVRIEPRAREAVDTELGSISATRYAYTGDLDTEVWYDDKGRWVKMRFKGRDGSTIDYVCRRCLGAVGRLAE